MRRVVIVAGVMCLSAAVAAGADETFQDTTFDPDGYTEVFTTGRGLQTFMQVPDGGNSDTDPDPFRQVQTISNAPVILLHLNDSFVVDPADGAIASVGFSIDTKAFVAFGQGMGFGLAAVQDSVPYRAAYSITGSDPGAFEWSTTWSASGAGDFTDDTGGGSVIDFGTSGSPITFGFYTANSGGNGITVGYDNLTVTVRRCDQTGDAIVDAADLASLLASWGSCDDCSADFDFDGDVDSADLAVLLSCWG